MKRNTFRLLAILIGGLVPGFLFTGCSTIMQGTTQAVGVSSTPTGALVTVNGNALGKTPLVTDLKRKDHHTVRIELDGYQPYEATLTRNLSGWVVGNIVFGGLIGLAVDAISGGMYRLTPDQINGTLAKQIATDDGDVLYIAVVLQADPEWERVGQLERVE